MRSSRAGPPNAVPAPHVNSPRRAPAAAAAARVPTPLTDRESDAYSRGDSPGPRLQQPVGPPSRSESPAHAVAATRTTASTPNRARAPSPSNGHTPRQGRDRRPSASSSHLPPLNFSRESAEQAYDAYDAYDAIVEPVPAAQDFTPRSAARPHLNTTSSNFSGVSPQSSSQDLGPRPAPRPHLDATSSGLSGLSAQSSYNPLPTSLKAPSSTNGRQPSPAPSTRSAKHSARGNTPTPSDTQLTRRDHNVRVSFFDPSNQAALDRLIAGEPGAENAGEGEEESAQATMTSVEEMLEGYEWASDNVIGQKTPRSAADLIEARLLDELMALDKV